MLWHRVQLTDTLGKLAQRYYGDWTMWSYIADHNEFIILNGTENNLTPGIHICIPYHHSLKVTVEPTDIRNAVTI